MTKLKLSLLALGVATLVVGAAVGVALLAGTGERPSPAATAAAPLPAELQPSAEAQIAFWAKRVEANPSGYLDLTNLGAAFVRRARETGDLDSYARAEAALRKALQISPTWTQASALLSSVLFSVHDFRGALRVAAPIADTAGGVQALATLGDAQLALGDYEAAEKAYAKLGTFAPAAPAVLSRQAALAELWGDRASARTLMRRAEGLAREQGDGGEGLAWYQFQLGELDFRSGLVAGAERWYRTALETFPTYYLALGGLAKARAAQGDYAGAIELYTQATEIVPQPELLAALGDVYSITGRKREAREQYETVQFIGTLATINRQVYNRQLATFGADHDVRLAEALRLAMDELAVRKDVWGYDAAAWASYKNGLLDQAAELAAKALQLGTQDARLFYHAGMIARAQGRLDEARELLGDALALNPHFDLLQAPIARAALDALTA
jgi:tetratricopeptide (TPR) repeat protein